MQIPESLLYSADHLWIKEVSNDLWEAGITDYAQNLLGDIVFIDAPAKGLHLYSGNSCGLVESVKTGSDLIAPNDGVVIEINETVINKPELINEKPYQAWIFKFKPTVKIVRSELLTEKEYQALIIDQ